jgi:transposase InsO family protein
VAGTWRDACAELGITPKRTRPYRPQANGKIERFHRTLADGWAFRRMFLSELARRQALPGWLHEYNHHRPHTAIGRRAPITRLTNLSGQYSYSGSLCFSTPAPSPRPERMRTKSTASTRIGVWPPRAV